MTIDLLLVSSEISDIFVQVEGPGGWWIEQFHTVNVSAYVQNAFKTRSSRWQDYEDIIPLQNSHAIYKLIYIIKLEKEIKCMDNFFFISTKFDIK